MSTEPALNEDVDKLATWAMIDLTHARTSALVVAFEVAMDTSL